MAYRMTRPRVSELSSTLAIPASGEVSSIRSSRPSSGGTGVTTASQGDSSVQVGTGAPVIEVSGEPGRIEADETDGCGLHD